MSLKGKVTLGHVLLTVELAFENSITNINHLRMCFKTVQI